MKRGYHLADDERQLEIVDRIDYGARQAADTAMQMALLREHPDRVTVTHPHGTKSPRRMPMPTGSSLKTNFD